MHHCRAATALSRQLKPNPTIPTQDARETLRMYDFHRCRTNGRPTPSSGPHRVRKGSISVFTKIGTLRNVRTSFERVATDSTPSKNVKYRFLMRFQRCEKRFKSNVIYTMQGASRMFLFENWGRAWTPQFFVLDRVLKFQ